MPPIVRILIAVVILVLVGFNAVLFLGGKDAKRQAETFLAALPETVSCKHGRISYNIFQLAASVADPVCDIEEDGETFHLTANSLLVKPGKNASGNQIIDSAIFTDVRIEGLGDTEKSIVTANDITLRWVDPERLGVTNDANTPPPIERIEINGIGLREGGTILGIDIEQYHMIFSSQSFISLIEVKGFSVRTNEEGGNLDIKLDRIAIEGLDLAPQAGLPLNAYTMDLMLFMDQGEVIRRILSPFDYTSGIEFSGLSIAPRQIADDNPLAAAMNINVTMDRMRLENRASGETDFDNFALLMDNLKLDLGIFGAMLGESLPQQISSETVLRHDALNGRATLCNVSSFGENSSIAYNAQFRIWPPEGRDDERVQGLSRIAHLVYRLSDENINISLTGADMDIRGQMAINLLLGRAGATPANIRSLAYELNPNENNIVERNATLINFAMNGSKAFSFRSRPEQPVSINGFLHNADTEIGSAREESRIMRAMNGQIVPLEGANATARPQCD